MISHIKTSKANKERVTQLTNKLNLGAENVIARIALGYSIVQDAKLDLNSINDSQGKEYTKSILFGDYYEVYAGLICLKYEITKSDKSLSKLMKIHLDKGIEDLNTLIEFSNEDSFSIVNNLINSL